MEQRNAKRRLIEILTLASLVVAPIVAHAEVAAFEEQSSAQVPAAGLRALDVENPRGRVTVTRAAGHEIRVTALKVVRGGDDRKSHRLADETQVVTETQGDTYRIRVQYPHRTIEIGFWNLFSHLELPRIDVRLAIEVPQGFAIHLHSTSGDLVCDGIGGPHTVQSTSGDVTVSGAGTVTASSTSGDVRVTDSGAAQLHTVSGDIVANRVHGTLHATTTSGDLSVRGGAAGAIELGSVSGAIEVEDAGRGLDAGTTSGSIEVGRVAGNARVRSVSGDVTLGIAAPFEGARVSTTNGDVRLRFAALVPCALDLNSTSGEIHVDLPLETQNATAHHVTGVVRRGTAPVEIHTASGDISLAEGAR